MAWIESHQGLGRHLKTKRFARKSGISIPAAIGHLHLLWWWALDNLPDGKVSDLEPEDLADEMMWTGDAQDLIESLIEVGFIDRLDEALYIHDWHDYIGKLLEKRKTDADRKRKSRESSDGHPPDRTWKGSGKGADVPQDGAGNRTVPNRTLPKDNKYKELVVEIVNYLNMTAGKNFSPETKETIKLISGRLSGGRTFEQFKYVIDIKSAEWKGNEKMDRFLKPDTLFAESNFESYLNEKPLSIVGNHEVKKLTGEEWAKNVREGIMNKGGSA